MPFKTSLPPSAVEAAMNAWLTEARTPSGRFANPMEAALSAYEKAKHKLFKEEGDARVFICLRERDHQYHRHIGLPSAITEAHRLSRSLEDQILVLKIKSEIGVRKASSAERA